MACFLSSRHVSQVYKGVGQNTLIKTAKWTKQTSGDNDASI